MSLRGVMPKNHVDGFMAELIKHCEPIVQSGNLGGALIDYCFEVAVTCDGSNPNYQHKGRATFVVSQFATPTARNGIVAGDAALPIIILDSNEALDSIVVEEDKNEDQRRVLAIFSIHNVADGTRRRLLWIVHNSEARVLN